MSGTRHPIEGILVPKSTNACAWTRTTFLQPCLLYSQNYAKKGVTGMPDLIH